MSTTASARSAASGTGTGGTPDVPATGADRRTRRREATKTEILAAAWALARSEGLTNFSMRDVATRVGMQAPSLYQYFDSKHAIYDAMFGQGARLTLETVCADLPATIDPTDRRAVLLELARRVFEFATEDAARMQLLFQRTIPGFDPSPESYAPAVEMSGNVAAHMVELGFTDPDAMDLFTAMVGGLVNQQMSNDPGGTRWARLLDRTVDMFIADMTPEGAAGGGSEARTMKAQSKTNPKTKTKTNTTPTDNGKKRGR